MQNDDFIIQFDVATIKHLGLQMYSTLPPVIGELVSNAWDADAEQVNITIPTGQLTDHSEIVIVDDGSGMSDSEVRMAYLIVGRDRRVHSSEITPKHNREVMGRKGIGKFSAFGIAGEIEVETIKDGEVSRFIMNYSDMLDKADERKILMPPLPPTGTVSCGTKVTLRKITKFHNRSIDIQGLRRGLSRRFSIIGDDYNFEVVINNSNITPAERDLKRLLQKDSSGKLYLWEYNNQEIEADTGWKVSGWIGTLDRTAPVVDGIQRGIVLMARGKMVQEPFVFDATVGQQYALSYIVGELHAEFVDSAEDTVGTTRNSLVWDTDANRAFKQWGQREVNRIAREWAEKRKRDNEAELVQNPLYIQFKREAEQIDDPRARKLADALIREVVTGNLVEDVKSQEQVIQLCLNFMEFDAFQEFARDLSAADLRDSNKILELFRHWEIVEAKEMMRVTEGRITTIEKLQLLIETDALEVPTLHNFLREFPWVLDPRWSLVADEQTYSDLLRKEFPEDTTAPLEERRIDFLCVRESETIIVVEIKRPSLRVSEGQFFQIENYVNFMRDYVQNTTDPELRHKDVVGYLLCGSIVNTWKARQKRQNLSDARIFVRLYSDLLVMVENVHREWLTRYQKLREAKRR